MELRKITDVLTSIQLDFITKKAYNYAISESNNEEKIELLYNKYFLQFMQESVISGMCN